MTDKEFAPVTGMGDNMTEEEKVQFQKYKEQEKKKQALARVLKGHNDIFEKEYNIEELELKFDIKIRFPNALEQAKIQAATERYLDGLGSLMAPGIVKAYRMLATIRECGTKVPEILAKDEDIYNISILAMIADDFYEWMNSFRY